MSNLQTTNNEGLKKAVVFADQKDNFLDLKSMEQIPYRSTFNILNGVLETLPSKIQPATMNEVREFQSMSTVIFTNRVKFLFYNLFREMDSIIGNILGPQYYTNIDIENLVSYIPWKLMNIEFYNTVTPQLSMAASLNILSKVYLEIDKNMIKTVDNVNDVQYISNVLMLDVVNNINQIIATLLEEVKHAYEPNMFYQQQAVLKLKSNNDDYDNDCYGF